jgi:hypothetical protein
MSVPGAAQPVRRLQERRERREKMEGRRWKKPPADAVFCILRPAYL